MLSILIASRNEYPQLVWTIYSFINDIPRNERYEVIVASNGASKETKVMDEWLGKGRLVRDGFLKLLSLPAMSPFKAQQIMSEQAEGDVLVIGDAHIVVQRGTLTCMLKLLQHKKGFVHSPMLYLGDINNPSHRKLYGYKHPIKRGWTFNQRSKRPYKCVSSGAGLMMTYKHEWQEVGGSNAPFHEGIGGGETLLDMKYWMFNKIVWIHPDCLYYHYARKRGYTWSMDQFYWNQFVAYYCLAGREFMEEQNKRVSYPQKLEFLDKVENTCQEHRKFIVDNATYTLTEVFEMFEAEGIYH